MGWTDQKALVRVRPHQLAQGIRGFGMTPNTPASIILVELTRKLDLEKLVVRDHVEKTEVYRCVLTNGQLRGKRIIALIHQHLGEHFNSHTY